MRREPSQSTSRRDRRHGHDVASTPIELKSEDEKAQRRAEERRSCREEAARRADGGSARRPSTRARRCEPFKDQLLLDITPEGLRIQIVDAQNRPMFDLGSARLKGYTNDDPAGADAVSEHGAEPHQPHRAHGHHALCRHHRLHELGSVDRSRQCGAARAGGGGPRHGQDRRAWSACLRRCCSTRTNPRNPINRRISIIVMTQAGRAGRAEDGLAGRGGTCLGRHAETQVVDAPTAPPT